MTGKIIENEDFLFFSPQSASYRLVVLHGWGADAEDLFPLGQDLVIGQEQPFELISLRAPELTPHGSGRQWYGLFPADWEAVPTARKALEVRLRALETPQIPLHKTILLGFSQGGAMAVASGCNLPLAGLIACSAYPHPGWSPPINRPPVILFHGEEDSIVPFSAGVKLFETLKIDKIELELFKFQGGHSIPIEIYSKIKNKIKLWTS